MNNHCPKCVQMASMWLCEDPDCSAGNYKPVETAEGATNFELVPKPVDEPLPPGAIKTLTIKWGKTTFRIPKWQEQTAQKQAQVCSCQDPASQWYLNRGKCTTCTLLEMRYEVTKAPQRTGRDQILAAYGMKDDLLPWKERVADLEGALRTVCLALCHILGNTNELSQHHKIRLKVDGVLKWLDKAPPPQ